MFKRTICLILSVILLITALSVAVSAEEDYNRLLIKVSGEQKDSYEVYRSQYEIRWIYKYTLMDTG